MGRGERNRSVPASRAAAGPWCCRRPGCDASPPGPCTSPSSSASKPGREHPLAMAELLEGYVLLLLVGQHGVSRSEVHRGYAERAESRHVRPPELRVHRATDRLDELLGGR